MFNTVLTEVKALFDSRFLLNFLFPSLVFWGLLVIVIFYGSGGDLSGAAVAWSGQDLIIKIFQIVGFIAFVTIFSGFINSLLPVITRFYEGYYLLPGWSRFNELANSHHKTRLEDLGKKLVYKYEVQTTPEFKEKEATSYRIVYSNYPFPTQLNEVMPTRFGNILKNAELYANSRYGLDAVVIWPRLYPLLPEKFIQSFAQAKSSVDFLLVISSLSGIFALLSGGALLRVKAPAWLFLLCFWGGLTVAYLGYGGAVANAVQYANQVKTGFDLYRLELFKAMNLGQPKSPQCEREQWESICKFFYRNDPNCRNKKYDFTWPEKD